MGGFGSALGDVAGKMADHISFVKEHVASVDRVFERTPQGQATLERLRNVYMPTKAASTEALTKQALDRVKLDPAKPNIDIGQIHSDSAKVARQALLGPNDVLGIMAAASIEKTHGVLAAQSYSNALAFVLKDYVDPMAAKNVEGAAKIKADSPYSSFKRNAVKAGVGLTSISPSYTPSGPLEESVRNAIYKAFAPLIVIPHIATTFNGMFGSDPLTFTTGLAKAATQSLDSGIDSFQGLVTSGAFAETHLRDVYEWNRFEATGHPEFSGSGAAKLVYNLFHQPGFSKLRDYTLLSGANTGKMTVEQLGRDFVKKPNDPKLLWQLSQFGLEPKKILEQGGKLDEADLSRAVYKFVDQHYFIDNTLQRSQLLQSSWQGRILGTFHGYVTRQSKLMAASMFGNIKNQGVASTIKNLAIGALLFPAMGEGIKVMQETYRGQANTFNEDVENIEGKHGAMNQLGTYGEMLGHIGAFGTYAHVIRGAYTNNILSSLAGPVVGAPAQVAQDVATASRNIYKGKKINDSTKPLQRDILFDTPGLNVLGQALSHRLVPNSKDSGESLRKLHEYMRGDSTDKNETQTELY